MSTTDLIDLDYEDAEPVELDISAIVRRGTRLRRGHLAARVAIVVVIFGLVPGAVTMDVSRHVAPPPVSAPGGINYGPASFGPASSGSARHRGAAQPKAGPAAHGSVRGGLEAPATAALSVELPARTGPVRGLAGARAGSGAWFWGADAGDHEVMLFHLNPAGHLAAWRVLPESSRLVTRPANGFAVSAGVAWLGLNRTLIRFDTATDSLTTWPLPHPVRELAIRPSGQVAIAMSGSASALLLTPGTGRFRAVRPEFVSGLLGGPPHDSQPLRQPGRMVTDAAGNHWVAEGRTVALVKRSR